VTPVVWLICLSALTLPVFVLGRRREVAGAGGSGRWVPAGGGLAAGVLAVLALGPGVPGAYAGALPDALPVAASVPPAPVSVPPGAAPSGDPGRVLDRAQASEKADGCG